MPETLGNLCDKLTIVKLKQWHSDEPERRRSLRKQQILLEEEINDFLSRALAGSIPSYRLSFAANKVYKKENNCFPEANGRLSEVISRLAEVNCKLWHEVEKTYDLGRVPPDARGALIRDLAALNLERNACIDQLDHRFAQLIAAKRKKRAATQGAGSGICD